VINTRVGQVLVIDEVLTVPIALTGPTSLDDKDEDDGGDGAARDDWDEGLEDAPAPEGTTDTEEPEDSTGDGDTDGA